MKINLIRRSLTLTVCSIIGLHQLFAQQAIEGDTVAPYRLTYVAHEFILGGEKVFDGYLSPLYYKGTTFGYRLTTEAPLSQRHPEWIVWQDSRIGVGDLVNSPKSSLTHTISAQTHWSFLHRWSLPYGISVSVGPGLLVEGGAYNNVRNQNNVADGMFNVDLSAAALVAYRLRIGWFISDLRLRMASAVVGVGFAPIYSESYLQASVYDKIIRHFDIHTWGRRHYYSIGLSIDVPVWRLTTLRVSYDYTNNARHIHEIYRGRSAHYFGIGLSTYIRPFRGYQEHHSCDHSAPLY